MEAINCQMGGIHLGMFVDTLQPGAGASLALPTEHFSCHVLEKIAILHYIGNDTDVY